MAKKTKGEPTSTNLFALAAVFGDAAEVANQLRVTDLPHIRRCFNAGLVSVSTDKSRLILTAAGAAILAAKGAKS